MKFKKLWPLVGALCVSMTSAFAHSNDNGSTYGSSMDSSSQSSQGTYQRGTFREITPNAGPRVAHGADVFITADFIWWKATQDGLNYAYTGNSFNQAVPANADATFAGSPKGRVATVGEDWAPGFKVGLGLNLAHDGWDLHTQYTWLRPHDHTSISGDKNVASTQPTSGVMNTPANPTDRDQPSVVGSRASARWALAFNVIDLELGRNFYLSQFLTMRPFIGLKGTWQDQKLTIKNKEGTYGINGPTGELPVTGPYKSKRHVDVWGIGIRSGFNVSWYISKCWSIYGDLSFSTMMVDYYSSERKDKIYDDTTNGTKTLLNLDNNDFYAVRYVGELELGLRWEMWFYDDSYHLAVQAGWEQQVWMNWMNFPQTLETSGSGKDLSLHGLNLKFRFDF